MELVHTCPVDGADAVVGDEAEASRLACVRITHDDAIHHLAVEPYTAAHSPEGCEMAPKASGVEGQQEVKPVGQVQDRLELIGAGCPAVFAPK